MRIYISVLLVALSYFLSPLACLFLFIFSLLLTLLPPLTTSLSLSPSASAMVPGPHIFIFALANILSCIGRYQTQFSCISISAPILFVILSLILSVCYIICLSIVSMQNIALLPFVCVQHASRIVSDLISLHCPLTPFIFTLSSSLHNPFNPFIFIILLLPAGLGFVLMAVGQIYSPPSHAAIILSLEGVFASVASYILLGEILSYRELCGCFLMLTAALIAKVGISCLDIKHGAYCAYSVQCLLHYFFSFIVALVAPILPSSYNMRRILI